MTAADLHPDSRAPRPGTCCGVCPPIAGGGWDCTCPGLPGCPANEPKRHLSVHDVIGALGDLPEGEDCVSVVRKQRDAADRPSVTDDARAEAYRRWPYINVVRRLAGESERERKNTLARDAFTAGAQWAAGRTETTTDDPHDGDGNRLTPDWQPETTTATTEEWAHRLENGGAMIWPTREQAEADREDYLSRPRDPFEPRPPASAGIWRREVTDWTEADQ